MEKIKDNKDNKNAKGNLTGFQQTITKGFKDTVRKVQFIQSPKSAQMSKSEFTTIVYIDDDSRTVHIGYMTAGDINTFTEESFSYKSRSFDKEFFTNLKSILEKHSAKHPSAQNADAIIVVPDSCISTDVVSMPTMRKMQVNQALDVLIRDLYKNSSSLKINHTVINQNKQYTSFGISIMNQATLSALYAVCATCKMTPRFVINRASAATNALQSINPKANGETCVFLDIKQEKGYFSLINRGRTAGFYSVPFGYNILQKSRLAAEDMLFDTPDADLLIVNAIEKAKAKQLSMMESDSATQTAKAMNIDLEIDEELSEEEADEIEETEETEERQDIFNNPSQEEAQTIKVLPKKTPRKLPKFMQRETPSGEQQYAFENFRLFMKWALNLIQQNKQLLGEQVENVYVNMPKELDYLFDIANGEEEENGVKFVSADSGKTKQIILKNMEIYGAFFDSPTSRGNHF